MTIRGFALSLIALTVWAYQSVFTAAWVFEDRTTAGYVHRSLTTWTWTQIDTPLGAHLVNLSLHLLLAACVTGFAQRLGVRGLGLWAAAGIWLLHPLNVETAAYAASRGELLAAIAVLTACRLGCGDWQRWPRAAAIAACLVMAMLSKESAVVGLILLPGVILWTDRSLDHQRGVPALVALVILSAGIWYQGGLRAVINLGTTDFVSATAITVPQWVGLQAAAAHHWIGSFVWLTGLTPDADVDAVPVVGRLLSVGILAGLGWCAMAMRQKAPLVTFGLGWCLLALVPRFIVQTPQSYLNAHQMTLPLVGLVIAVADRVSALDAWWETRCPA